MNTLFEKSIRTLELPAVLSMLAALAVSIATYYLIEKPAARHFKKTAQKMHA